MRSLPPKMTFSQKWAYGFYDHIVDKIKTGSWVTLRTLVYGVITLFCFGFILRGLPLVAQVIVKIIQTGMNIFS